MRDGLLFLHVVGAAGWIGGGLFGIIALGRLAKAGGEGVGRSMEIIVEKAGIYFTVVSMLVLLPGIALVLTEDSFGWGDTFVWFGIGAILLSGAWQGLVAGKKDAKLLDAVKNDSPERLALLGSWWKTAFVDAGILLIALWAMVVKL